MQIKLGVRGDWNVDPNEATVERLQAMRLKGEHDVTDPALIQILQKHCNTCCAALPEPDSGEEEENVKYQLEQLASELIEPDPEKFRLTCSQLQVHPAPVLRCAATFH